MTQRTEAQIAFSESRSAMLFDEPFFGSLALRLEPVETTAVRTVSTNGRLIKFNPIYFMKLDPDLRISVIAHEVMTCGLMHVSRRDDRNKRIWGIASDFVVNEFLAKCNMPLDKTWFHDKQFYGMSVEHVYALLIEQAEKQEIPPEAQPQDDIEDDDPDEFTALDEMAWNAALDQAARIAKSRKNGNLPADMERFISDNPASSKHDWRQELRHLAMAAASDDYSWKRVNKKMLAGANVYMPGLWSEQIGQIVFGIDTSGSIDGPTLNAVAAEVDTVAAQCRPEKVWAAFCDAQMQRVQEFERGEPIKLQPKGGGGTDFRPVFDWVEENDIEPACLIFLTDGYGTYPTTAPGYPVIWCMITDHQPPWGDVVRIEI